MADLHKASFKLHDGKRHFVMKAVTVQLRIIGKHMNIHIVLLNDFGKVRHVHNEETGTENRSLCTHFVAIVRLYVAYMAHERSVHAIGFVSFKTNTESSTITQSVNQSII